MEVARRGGKGKKKKIENRGARKKLLKRLDTKILENKLELSLRYKRPEGLGEGKGNQFEATGSD